MIESTISFVLGLPAWLLLAAGVPMLLIGAERLVDGAATLARLLGCSPLLIGLTIVAFGTSAPELAVNLIAAAGGNTGLSFGNVVGSNIANIGLVIGLGALVAPIGVHSRVIRFELPLLIFVSGVTMVLALVPAGVGRTDGAVMLAGFGAYCVLWYRLGRRDAEDSLAREARTEAGGRGGAMAGVAVLMIVGGLAALLLGGKFTEHGAVEIASALGLSNALIGMTIVAIATSLPEVVTVMVAARKGHADLAMGNVIGSNVFNLLLVLAITSIMTDIPLPAHGAQDLVVMLVMTILLLVVAVTRKPNVSRIEGLGLLILYAAYLTWGTVRELA